MDSTYQLVPVASVDADLPQVYRFQRTSQVVTHYKRMVVDPTFTKLIIVNHSKPLTSKHPLQVPMSQVPPEVQQILLVTLNPLKCEASCWGYIAREVVESLRAPAVIDGG